MKGTKTVTSFSESHDVIPANNGCDMVSGLGYNSSLSILLKMHLPKFDSCLIRRERVLPLQRGALIDAG